MAVMSITIIFGTVMYLVESPEAGFTSIPTSIYWAIVTLTTVGYGDIAPQTWFGQFLAAAIMILGYAIVAVPMVSSVWVFTRAGPRTRVYQLPRYWPLARCALLPTLWRRTPPLGASPAKEP